MMSRLVKIVDNKYVQIEEHKSPNICFNTNEYDDFEDYCTLRETFDPFEMFYENQGLKKQLEEERNKVREYSYKLSNFRCEETYENQQKKFIKYLEDKRDKYAENLEYWSSELISIILSKYRSIIGDDK